VTSLIDWESLKGDGGEFVRRYGVLLISGLVGLFLVGYGVYSAIRPERPTVEIVKSEVLGQETEGEGQIMVDVAGAVEKPGLYELPKGARIGDALVIAGGLDALADRGWVARYINLASKLEDGAKIYIPENSENSSEQITGGEEKSSGLVNVNTASRSELESLWGIGEVRAQAIIENRPYGTLEEIMSKAGIPESVYAKIKDEVAIY